jgi:hypothetical protein
MPPVVGSLAHLIRRLRYGEPIIVVSGLPRSGTSMVMRMLQAGGIPVLSDDRRVADEGNPHGYFELEQVKQLSEAGGDTSWLSQARGKAVKIVSYLLTWLPESYDYRVFFIERDLDEVVASQQKLFALRGEHAPPTTDADSRELFRTHLEQVHRLLASRRCFMTARVRYRDVVEDPRREAQRIAQFLEVPLNTDKMIAAVDRTLYRNRASGLNT